MSYWANIVIAIATVSIIFGGCGVSVAFHIREVRRRTRAIRERDIPPFAMWRKGHYPKATPQEAETIEAVLKALATLGETEPMQLRPDDALEGFVLERRRVRRSGFFGEEDDWSDLLEELADSVKWHLPELAPWELEAYASWETVGDVIDFMLKRARHARDARPSRRSA